MRCSSCESFVGEYVEGALAPRRARAVAAHLRTCPACRALYDRLRNVDALLVTARAPELAPEFTRSVMERVRTMPPPPRERRRLLPLALLYLGFAWAAAIATITFFWPEFSGGARLAGNVVASSMQSLAYGAHAAWPIAPLATLAGASLLSVDLLLLAAAFAFYRSVRPRLAAALAARSAR